jgi:hypothetical protein
MCEDASKIGFGHSQKYSNYQALNVFALIFKGHYKGVC